MIIYLLRHTRIDLENGICYGQMDVDVASSFNQEIITIENQLNKIPYDIIFSSPLKRCTKLANAINKNKIPIHHDDRLKELNFGDWEGKYWKNIQLSKEAKHWFNDYINLACPNGESYIDLVSRVKSFISNLKSKYRDKIPLIVCHAGTIKAFQAIITKNLPKDAMKFKIDFGQIIELEFK